MPAQIQAHLHAGVPAPHHQDLLPGELLPGLVLARVQDAPGEPPHAWKLRDVRLGVLARRHHEPPGHQHLAAAREAHGPGAHGRVERGLLDAGAEARRDARRRGVPLHVRHELVLAGVRRVLLRERDERELAEALGEVEREAVVHAVAPREGQRVGPLQHRGWHAAGREAGGRGEPRGARADDDGAGDPRRAPLFLLLLVHGFDRV